MADRGVFVIGTGLEEGAALRVWRWQGGRFEPIGGDGPPVRVGASPVYDHARGILIYFGGADANGRPSAALHEFDGTRWHMR
jgi:hypothetical protein